ncbi:MAG: porin [Myxococcaceae bacterium]
MNRLLGVTLLLATLPMAAGAQEKEKERGILERLELSGYIQARYVVDQQSTVENPLDRFFVRRGRLKATYDADWSKYVLQIDASSSGLSLKDAEVHLIEPWTPYKLELAIGQMKWPFGFEVMESSSVREFPERSRVVRAFASNERDRGAKFIAKIGWFRFQGGVFDGNGIDRPQPFFGRDNDNAKDVIARAGVDFGWLSGGVSGWYGDTFRHAGAVPGAPPAAWFPRTRLGADLQLKGDLIPLGKSIFKAEYIAGRTYWESGREQFGDPALGWYLALNQHLGKYNVVSFRYDYFDPLAGSGPRESASEPGRPDASNPIGTYTVALSHSWYEHVRLTVAYEIPVTVTPAGTSDPDDNLLTLQAQVKY